MEREFKSSEELMVLEMTLTRLYARFHHLNNMRVTIATFYTSFVGAMLIVSLQSEKLSGLIHTGAIFFLISVGVLVSAFEQIVHDRALDVRGKIKRLEGAKKVGDLGIGWDDALFSALPISAVELRLLYGYSTTKNMIWPVSMILAFAFFCFWMKKRWKGNSPFRNDDAI